MEIVEKFYEVMEAMFYLMNASHAVFGRMRKRKEAMIFLFTYQNHVDYWIM